jgi:hypothetical protein
MWISFTIEVDEAYAPDLVGSVGGKLTVAPYWRRYYP